jgi:small subunit ribosomal protein S17
MKKTKNIGINVESPSKECNDKNCPFHGVLKLRGRTFVGKIVSKDTHKTAKIEWSRIRHIKKYERIEHRTSKLKVHNPPCLDCNIGDTVKVIESRPISKTKKFVIVEKIK